MAKTHKDTLTRVMNLAWTFVKQNGMNLSEALKKAWANIKLKAKMFKGVVEFRFVKMDGTIRQAFGTLAENLIPATSGEERARGGNCQTFYDTEKGAWRCFKRVNLLG